MTRKEEERLSPEQIRRGCVESFAHEVVVALCNARLHSPSTSAARTQLQTAVTALGSVFAAGARSPLRLETDGVFMRWDGRTLVGASLQARHLVRLLVERGVQAIEFDTTLDAESLGRFLELLAEDSAAAGFRPESIDHVLGTRGVHGIAVQLRTPGEQALATPQSALGTGEQDREALESYQQLAQALQESHVAAQRGDELEIDLTRGVVERTVARMADAPSDLLALAVYDEIDRFTVGHSVRVALLALETARATGASDQQLLLVGTAGLLHDIGKSHVPQQVLFKQGPLDQDEWRAMAEHPRLGAEILLEQRDVHPSAIGAAFCHHMAPDDSGYPSPAARFDPSGISRLIRICDVFEALTSIRPYKQDLSPLAAMTIMHRQTGGFDRRWLRFFFRTIGIYPVGTRLRLDTGEKALVVRHGPSCEQPVVRLLETADGAPVVGRREAVVGMDEEGAVRRVTAVVRRRAGGEHEDPSARAVAPFQHACLGPGCHLDGGHRSPD